MADNREKWITITLRFYAGTETETNLKEYDRAKGAVFQVRRGSRLKTLFKRIEFRPKKHHTFFRDCERISERETLRDMDEISCLRATGGG